MVARFLLGQLSMDHAELQGYLYIPCKTLNASHNPVCEALNKISITPTMKAGLETLLVNFDEDSGAGRRFTRGERAAVAVVRRWLKRQLKEKKVRE